MSQLKEIITNSLRLKQVSPEIIGSVDTLIQRSLIDLSRQDLIPARSMEFISLDKKQERRNSEGELVYNFYYLPEDFRKLDWFRPRKNNPYVLEDKLYELYGAESNLTNKEKKQVTKKFGIFDTHQEDDSKFEKILVAFPFPDDDEIIDLKYYSNGANQNWDWLGEEYWEVIISWIYTELGLRSPQELEDDLGKAVSQTKEQKGSNMDNGTFLTLGGSYFGKKERNYIGSRRRRNK